MPKPQPKSHALAFCKEYNALVGQPVVEEQMLNKNQETMLPATSRQSRHTERAYGFVTVLVDIH